MRETHSLHLWSTYVADDGKQTTNVSSSATAGQHPYAAAAGRMIFLAAVDSRDPQTGEVRGTTAGEQTELLFLTMKQTLESLGSSLDNVASVTTVLTDAHHRRLCQGETQIFASCATEQIDLWSTARASAAASPDRGHGGSVGLRGTTSLVLHQFATESSK